MLTKMMQLVTYNDTVELILILLVHLEMMYTHSTHRGNSKAPSEHTVNERYFYKLLFLPDEMAEFARVRDALDRITV